MFTIYYVRKEWVFLPLYVELQCFSAVACSLAVCFN